MSENVTEAVREHAMSSIAMMRKFMDEAERSVSMEDNPERIIHAVLQGLGWGQANAMTSLQTALSYMRRGRHRKPEEVSDE